MKKQSTNNIFETAYSDESNNSTDFLTIPDSRITYARDTIFKTWQILECQLKQTDSEYYPEIHAALEKRTEFLFNIWLQFEVI